jgi:gluconate 2-dehydrogenase gamma chain
MKLHLKKRLTRRQAIVRIGLALSSFTALGRVFMGSSRTATSPATKTIAQPDVAVSPWRYFTAEEAAFVDAAVDRLIPTDTLGPGARAAGVTEFIDSQLVDAWGRGEKLYRSRPYEVGTVTQGYQLNHSPQTLYRQSIRRIEARINVEFRMPFAQLDTNERDAVLEALEAGTLDTDSEELRAFFQMLRQNTIEGFFADPIYGGNRNKIGWHLVGFPGVFGVYTQFIGENRPIHPEPVSLQDLQHGGHRHG